MRVFCWTREFHINRESSLVSVWVSLPALPIHFYDKHSLFFILSPVGAPLFLDSATMSGARPTIARACVEIDLLKPVCTRVWVAVEGEMGFWQSILVEHLPSYCSSCWRLGHSNAECKKDRTTVLHQSQPARNLGGNVTLQFCSKEGVKAPGPGIEAVVCGARKVAVRDPDCVAGRGNAPLTAGEPILKLGVEELTDEEKEGLVDGIAGGANAGLVVLGSGGGSEVVEVEGGEAMCAIMMGVEEVVDERRAGLVKGAARGAAVGLVVLGTGGFTVAEGEEVAYVATATLPSECEGGGDLECELDSPVAAMPEEELPYSSSIVAGFFGVFLGPCEMLCGGSQGPMEGSLA
ncbi:uncharacterized protein LOC113755095 [Coffea eugenioides]|uniref:uncharacterized protein LOC113755095 n=1 Tax=Coffea eugenioides TaxID=49369 RepID=UPI000F607AEE|nr:uncharacterized protein LOC113755095 [Coffea eugenioides]